MILAAFLPPAVFFAADLLNGTALLKFLPGWVCCGRALMGLRGGPYIAGMVLVRSEEFWVGWAAAKSPSSKAYSQQVGAVSSHAEVQGEHSELGLTPGIFSAALKVHRHHVRSLAGPY